MKLKSAMSTNLYTLTPDSSVLDATNLMAAKGIGIVPILDNEGKPQGVLTDRDIALRVVGENIPPTTPIGEIMTGEPCTVKEDEELSAALTVMQREKIGRVLVCDGDGKVTGLLSLGDAILKGRHTEQTLRVSAALATRVHKDVQTPRASLR